MDCSLPFYLICIPFLIRKLCVDGRITYGFSDPEHVHVNQIVTWNTKEGALGIQHLSSKMKNPKVDKACYAMKALGISTWRVKPVLNKLLKLYAKHWEFIEADNYRVLVEAIIDNKKEKDDEVLFRFYSPCSFNLLFVDKFCFNFLIYVS